MHKQVVILILIIVSHNSKQNVLQLIYINIAAVLKIKQKFQ